MGRSGGPVVVAVARLRASARLPQRMSTGASGFDLHASLDEPIEIPPGGRHLIPTGIAIQIPAGYEGQVRPRSGLAARHGIGVLNAPGTIDSDYRGEVGVILVNLGEAPAVISDGDRIAQLVIVSLPGVALEWSESLDTTDRGSGGFGHTGVRPPSTAEDGGTRP